MSNEDNIGMRNPETTCLVCGKGVEREDGFAKIKHGDSMIALCCPLCLETYQKDPTPFLNRLAKQYVYRAARSVSRPQSPLNE